jgi:hypothetical protein
MQRRALVVGISQYSKVSLGNFVSFANNANAIADILEPTFKVQRLPEAVDGDRVRVGKSAVTYDRLQNELKELFTATDLDVVLFYFSGHGLKGKQLFPRTYLSASDSEGLDDGYRRAFEIEDLKSLLKNCPAREQIVWLDCCYGGDLANFAEVCDRNDGKTRFIITASRSQDPAYQEIVGEMGVFTRVLVSALARTGTTERRITCAAIEDAVREKLQSLQYPQMPQFYRTPNKIIEFWEREAITKKDTPKKPLKRSHRPIDANYLTSKAVKREIPRLLPYLPNRHEQEFEFKQAYKSYQEFLNQGLPRPLVCIIHSDEFQTHDMFFERLHKYSVPQLLGLDRNQKKIQTYFLPCQNSKYGLETQLCEELAKNVLDSSYSSLEAINETFCKYPGPIIVCTHLLTEHWQQEGEILKKFLGFWQGWPDLVLGQQLIICLFVKYQKKGRSSAKRLSFSWLWNYLKEILIPNYYRRLNTKIYKQLTALSTSEFRQFDRIYSIVLPELTGISRMHVEEWARSKETIQFVGEDMTQKLISEIREMFESWEHKTSSSTIPMEDLAENLKNLLKALTDERGVA